jgi:phosphoglycolate phosphatase-like HAD superfamily hydrolase
MFLLELFLAAAQRLNVRIARAMVVGDSLWDLLAARRAGCPGIGLLSGGYGKEELEQVGAYRVYLDPADCWPTSMKLASDLWIRCEGNEEDW